jgi:NAD(P)H-dependent flavin oxidoreductase YrpB (nitropropane dioxygenase family)
MGTGSLHDFTACRRRCSDRFEYSCGGCGWILRRQTLAASIVIGAAGAQLGTRFLATQESDFHPLWKEQVVKTQDRGTLVARGMVGPARWLRTPSSVEHQKNTLLKSPTIFLDTPDDYGTAATQELITYERKASKPCLTGTGGTP